MEYEPFRYYTKRNFKEHQNLSKEDKEMLEKLDQVIKIINKKT